MLYLPWALSYLNVIMPSSYPAGGQVYFQPIGLPKNSNACLQNVPTMAVNQGKTIQSS